MTEELQIGFPILSVLLLLPLAGALLMWVLQDEDLIKNTALGVSIIEFVLSAVMLFRFVPDSAAMQFAERARWIPPLGISYHLGVDGISVLFVGLTAFLTLLIVIYSADTVRQQVKLPPGHVEDGLQRALPVRFRDGTNCTLLPKAAQT